MLWFQALNMREILDKLNGNLPLNSNMAEYSFHHEPPYRHHWHTLFESGEFTKNHKQGSMKF